MSPKNMEDKILPQRFELIKTMYFSDKIVAPVKKDKILDWFFCQFEIYKKNMSSLQYKLLWETFYSILQEERQSSSQHRILIKSQSSEIFLVTVKNYPFDLPWAHIILSSICLFLETSTVNSSFIVDSEKLLHLLIETIKIMSESYLVKSRNQQTLEEAMKLANTILDILENLSSSNEEIKKRIFSSFVKHIACFVHISDSENNIFESIVRKLIKQITTVFFNLKSKPYEDLLSTVEKRNYKIKTSSTLQFFCTLQMALLNEDLFYSKLSISVSSAILMKKIVLSFIVENKSSYQTLKVLSLFFAVNGLDIPIILGEESCCNSHFKGLYKKYEINLLGLCHLLEACSAIPQFFTSVNAPDSHIKPSLWLQGVSASLLNLKDIQKKAVWLKCFQHVLQIAPTIIDCDIVPLIKTAFLNISVPDEESKIQYCELFKVILKAHLQLYQSPKFFVKFLLALTECIKENSGGEFVTNGRILPEVEEALAKCVQELPYGQMIEIWGIFITTFSTLENMSEVFMTNRCFIFLVAQMFSTFLLHAQLFHANIPSNIHSKFKELIIKTCVEVEKNISSLKEDHLKFAPLQRSVLLLSYAVGEIKLAYNAYYDEPVDDSKYEETNNVFDFSILHSYLNIDYAPILEHFLNGNDKVMAVLVFQLLLQKAKAFQFRGILTEQDSDHIKCVTSSILLHLETGCSAIGLWDSDLCQIVETNYNTAMWMMFLKVCPSLLSSWCSRDIYKLSNSVQRILLDNECSENSVKSAILSSLKNDFFKESKLFQTALISVIWREESLLTCKKRSHSDSEMRQTTSQRIFTLLNTYHSKGLKYAERTPKSDKSLGSVWSEIKEIAELLNSALVSDSLPKDKLVLSKLVDVLKFFELLPLEYLLPGNQMKCLLGLSFIFFLLPQSSKSTDLTKQISSLLLSVFEGVRSIWLFDFVTSGPYIKYIVKTVEAAIADECEDIDWAQHLIDSLISFISRSAESLSSLELYITRLSSESKSSRTTSIIFLSLLKKLSQLLSRPHKLEDYKDVLQSISSTTCASFVKHMKANFNKDNESKDHYFFILSYNEVVEIMYCPAFVAKDSLKEECLDLLSSIPIIAMEKISSSNVNSLIDAHLLFVSKIAKHFSKISSFLPDDFESASWMIVLSYFEKKAQMKKGDFICADINADFTLDAMPCSICHCKCDENWNHSKTIEQISQNVPSTMLINSEKECLKGLSTISSDEKILEVFEHILNKMGFSNPSHIDVSTFSMYLEIFQSLITVNIEKCQKSVLNQCVQKCLTFLNSVINQICNSQVCQTMILIPCLDFMSFVLAGNKGIPKQLLYQCLNFVAPVPFDVQNDYELYSRSFTAAWNVVYQLFMYQTDMILASPAPFLTYVSKLLKSIVKVSAVEQLSKCNNSTLQKIQLCAQNMNRLLTVISRYKKEFAKLVPYLVADYVDTVQHITLESNIKESILSGIYRLLDLCSEDSIKMLAVNINYVGREIYENLVRSFKQNKHTHAT